MHNKNLPTTTPKSAPLATPAKDAASSPSACPYVPPEGASTSSKSTTASTLSKLNPLNYMPANLSNVADKAQKTILGVDREISTIPKGDGSLWEYPSPQQMYNAMLRKGGEAPPEDAVESMVLVHNFLNEGAWNEIMEWERRFAGGLSKGWRSCKRGEDGSQYTSEGGEWVDAGTTAMPRLLRFMGRPTEPTPKARILQTLGYVWPSQFGGEGPFDRHDWYVQRTLDDGSQKEVRYVIDYYSGEPEPTGEPVFFLDVRPAIDSPTQACERLLRWGGDIWWRGTGGVVREQARAAKAAETLRA